MPGTTQLGLLPVGPAQHQHALQPLLRLQCLKEHIWDHPRAGLALARLPWARVRRQLLGRSALNHQQIRRLGGHGSPTGTGQRTRHRLELDCGHLLGRLELDVGQFRSWTKGLELNPTHFLRACLPTRHVLQNYEALPSHVCPSIASSLHA